MAYVIPKSFTKADVDLIRAKRDEYAAQRDEAASIVSFIDGLAPETQIEFISHRETAASRVTIYTGKVVNQQEIVDACVAAGVDK